MQEATNAISQMRFPQKLWYLLDLQTSAIIWGGTGRTILLNYRLLQSYLQCDHSIFKTTNISSFIRQLNLYGFRKVTSHLQDPLCNSSNPYMHEFIHDNFQYGRPELLNKITRKALTMKRGFKQKNLEVSDNFLYISPLQKARRALRIALKKAAHDFLILNSSKNDSSFDVEGCSEETCDEEENIDVDWISSENISEVQNMVMADNATCKKPKSEYLQESTQDGMIDFSVESCQQNENFASQFINPTGANFEPIQDNSEVELLAEFNINNEIDDNIIKKNFYSESNSLNCVLPSVSDELDDVEEVEKNDVSSYNSEWDQMFNVIIDSKSSSDGGSNSKDLYSQISQTIDLLNS